MNIFYLDKDIEKAAKAHIDKHIVKMPLETAQIICTALHSHAVIPQSLTSLLIKNPLPSTQIPYKPTHRSHPCVKWAAKSRENFEWLVEFGLILCVEYTERYERGHACQKVFERIVKEGMFRSIPSMGGRTSRPQAMPEKYKSEDPVEAYRAYYRNEKKDIASWKNRTPPEWWKESQ